MFFTYLIKTHTPAKAGGFFLYKKPHHGGCGRASEQEIPENQAGPEFDPVLAGAMTPFEGPP